MNKWIPVEQEKPKTKEGVSEFVLVSTKERHVLFARYFKSEKNGEFWSTADLRRMEVIAWMYVPEPYMLKENETKDPNALYGYCPICGLAGDNRERRPNGNDWCPDGHVYPSKMAAKTPLVKRSIG